MALNKSFTNKVIAVTGAASSIGLGVANCLGDRGAILSLADVQKTALERTAADILARNPGSKILTTELDISKADQVKAWITDTVRMFGRLDGAANIAGVSTKSDEWNVFAEVSDEVWDHVLGVNLMGVVYSMREQLKVMTPGGSIVNASSVAGIRATPWDGCSPYVASKHAVIGLSKNAAREYGKQGTRINCICPGAVETTIARPPLNVQAAGSAHISPIPRVGQPEEIAALTAFLLGDESKFITGTGVVIDGGWTA